jgi:drug/metabolite transporter (DMT)-like permease
VSRDALSRLSIQLYLVPIVSVIGGILILSESLTLFTVAGGGVMLFAIALATRTRS